MFTILYNYIYYYASTLFKSNLVAHPKLKHKYFITYDFEGKKYNLLVSKRRGPHNIICVQGTKENGGEETDVSDYITQFMGPNLDFHNINYTPSCLGLHTITFYFMNDTTKTFVDNEIIRL